MDDIYGVEALKDIPTGDFRNKPVETIRLNYIVFNADPRLGDMQRDVYKLLEGLMSVPGLIRSQHFEMSMGPPSLETNEVTIKLQFDLGEEDDRGTDQLDEGDHHNGEESPDAGEPVDDREGRLG